MIHSLLKFTIGSMVVLNAIRNTWSSDWPEFRGPKQNGVCTEGSLPIRWSETENVVWHSKTEGLGWSSPIIIQNRIFFTTAVPATSRVDAAVQSEVLNLQLVCLEASTGKQLFAKTVFEQSSSAPKIHAKNSHASPSPIALDNRVYVHFGHQGTACLDLDGHILWKNQDHPYPPTHGNGGSPILVDGLLILTCDGGDQPCTLALDAKSGKEVWKTIRDVKANKTFSFCTPQFIHDGKRQQIVSVGSNVVQSLSPTDGRELWRFEYNGYSVVPRPVYHQGTLFICTGYDKASLLAIDPTGSGNVTETHLKWKLTSNVSLTPSLIAVDDALILVSDNGIATSVRCSDGQEKWRKRIGGNYSSSPLLSKDLVYFQSEQGDATILKWSDSQEVSKSSLPGRIFASYAVIDNDLIIRSENGIYRIGNR